MPNDSTPNAMASITSSPQDLQDGHAANSDLAAGFLTSFHHTQGNTVDWILTIDDAAYTPVLSGVEFNSIPSGLHEVERDVM